MSKSWPVILRHGDVTVRPMRISDARRWHQLRLENQSWLHEWEATLPAESSVPALTYRQSARKMLREAKSGTCMPFIVEYQGIVCGQLTVSGIAFGSLRSCNFGYWIAQEFSGRSIMTTAVALVTDHLFYTANLHRVEVAVRPENIPSNRLVERLGFELEGVRKKFLHINGDWRDHNIYVLRRDQILNSRIAQITK